MSDPRTTPDHFGKMLAEAMDLGDDWDTIQPLHPPPGKRPAKARRKPAQPQEMSDGNDS
jgi:hypothetical protein